MKYFVLILIAVAVLFYWFQFRPAEIRKQCLTKLQDYAEGKKDLSNSSGNNYYRMCLSKNGMKAEDLVR